MDDKTRKISAIAIGLLLAGGIGAGFVTAQENNAAKMSFFITSVGSGKGGDLGGLAGADAHCASLAQAAGSPKSKTWRAYLSSTGSGTPIHARDRIGRGPWFNAKGVQVAANVDELHSEAAKTGKEGSLTEKGATVNGRGDTPNQHDILTGSDGQGRLASPPPGRGGAAPTAANATCNDWTSSSTGIAMVGHHDRQGGGQNPTSWNSAHASRSCSQPDLIATGGNGYFYCFAPN